VRLDLNLAQAESTRGRWRPRLWVAGAALVAGVTAAQGIYYHGLARTVAASEGRLRALEQEVKTLEAQEAQGVQAKARAALAALPARVEAYNRILTAGAFSWTALLVELEASLPPNVGLTAIQPEQASGVVLLQGMAKSLADITAFVALLEQRPAFRDVFLLRHAEQGRGGAEAGALQDFSIRLVYGAAS